MAVPLPAARSVGIGEEREDEQTRAWAEAYWLDEATGEVTEAWAHTEVGAPTAEVNLYHAFCEPDPSRPGVWLCTYDIEVSERVPAADVAIDVDAGLATVRTELACGAVDLTWRGGPGQASSQPMKPALRVEGDRITLQTHEGYTSHYSDTLTTGSACGLGQPASPGVGWIDSSGHGRRATYVDLELD